jgi:hypothetical protein
MMRDWQPAVMYADPSTSAGLRIILQSRYRHLVLKFTTPPVSDRYEASWTDGSFVADSEDELLSKLLEELKDCGTKKHDWVTKSEIRDPSNPGNFLRTQLLECIYCDSRERVITISNPLSQESPAKI